MHVGGDLSAYKLRLVPNPSVKSSDFARCGSVLDTILTTYNREGTEF
jgi:hypothetical protein